MTEDVIYRCWKRTGILSDELEDIIDKPLDDEIEIEDESFQLLIDQMIVDNAVVRAEDYIEIDNMMKLLQPFKRRLRMKEKMKTKLRR